MRRLIKLWHDHAGAATIAQTGVGIVMAGLAIWSFIQTGSYTIAAIMFIWTLIACSLQIYSGLRTQAVA